MNGNWCDCKTIPITKMIEEGHSKDRKMSAFKCLNEVKTVTEVRFLTCTIKEIKLIEYPKSDKKKGTVILEVIDKTVEKPVECWLLFDTKKPFEGAIAPGVILCLRNITVDNVNEHPVLVVDPVDDPLCRYFGFNLMQNDLSCILAHRQLKENERAICDGEEKRLRGVRQFVLDKTPDLRIEAKPLFKVQLVELEVFLRIKDEPETVEARKEDTDSSRLCETSDDLQNDEIRIIDAPINDENLDPQDSWQDDLVAEEPPLPKPQYDLSCQLTQIQYCISCRYYNIACQIVGVYERNPSNMVLRVTDGTFVKNRELIKVPLFDIDGAINQELADKYNDRLYDIDVYDEYADQSKLFSPGDLVVIVNVHTYVNSRNGEIFTLHRNGQRFRRGIYELKADSSIGMALLWCLARAQQSIMQRTQAQ